MISPTHYLLIDHHKKQWANLLVAAALSTTGLLLGIVPNLSSPNLQAAFNTTAHAQSISDADVENYARSVLQIEPLRREALNQMQNVLGSGASIPNFMCNRPETVNNLPQTIRQIAVDYCQNSAQIASRNDLPSGRFNAITAAQQSDRTLADRIRQALIRLQRNP